MTITTIYDNPVVKELEDNLAAAEERIAVLEKENAELKAKLEKR